MKRKSLIKLSIISALIAGAVIATYAYSAGQDLAKACTVKFYVPSGGNPQNTVFTRVDNPNNCVVNDLKHDRMIQVQVIGTPS